ncbi:hypothetical protein ACFC0D_12100 [Streptomyces sp. NPDC056222]|uniref:hypothetical protein n=1 Tax=Streptomyces sp. NPDC056222 TaxID=3345749 RepID=UPI0035E3A531
MRKTAALVLAAGALVAGAGGSASADVLSGTPLSGRENTDQDGEQNLDCGNSVKLIRLNVADTVNYDEVCVDNDGHTRRYSSNPDGARVTGDTAIGPQVNTAQTGKQNLNCGNSTDVITVNVLGTINRDTTCIAVDRSHEGIGHGHGGGGSHTGGSEALGGTAVGQQVNTAQTGKQNLYCGNSADTLTVNVVGTIRKRTTCVAADHSDQHGQTYSHRGRTTADGGQAVGFTNNTSQNGRQNQTCGDPGRGIDLPLGETKRDTVCKAHVAGS